MTQLNFLYSATNLALRVRIWLQFSYLKICFDLKSKHLTFFYILTFYMYILHTAAFFLDPVTKEKKPKDLEQNSKISFIYLGCQWMQAFFVC